MKRKVSHRYFNRDRNKELMHTCGETARDEGKPLAACPALREQMRDNESYAVILIGAWREGWNKRDLELRSPRLGMKGAD